MATDNEKRYKTALEKIYRGPYSVQDCVPDKYVRWVMDIVKKALASQEETGRVLVGGRNPNDFSELVERAPQPEPEETCQVCGMPEMNHVQKFTYDGSGDKGHPFVPSPKEAQQ